MASKEIDRTWWTPPSDTASDDIDPVGRHLSVEPPEAGLVISSTFDDVVEADRGPRLPWISRKTCRLPTHSISMSKGLNAPDWEAIDLLSMTSGAIDVRGAPVDPIARRVWGVPTVLNQGRATTSA
jgi:hypothetical protein